MKLNILQKLTFAYHLRFVVFGFKAGQCSPSQYIVLFKSKVKNGSDIWVRKTQYRTMHQSAAFRYHNRNDINRIRLCQHVCSNLFFVVVVAIAVVVIIVKTPNPKNACRNCCMSPMTILLFRTFLS